MRLPTVEDIERLIPRPEDFNDRARGPRTTSRLGLALALTFTICFLTGLWSHVQQDPVGWIPLGPNPASLYRVTQGLHVISGIAAIPILLVKLWSVFPRLFVRPPNDRAGLVVHGLERISIGVLVGAGIFMLVSGSLNIIQWYPWNFSFRATHYAMAWIAIGAILVHVAVKLPVIRTALGASIDDDPDQDPPDDQAPTDTGPTRRAVLVTTGVATGLAVLLTAGQTITPLRRISVFGVRDGDGPQDLPINRTARAAGATATALDPEFRLTVVNGAREISLSRADLVALEQQTHRLPLACVEGWSRSADWGGVPVKTLLAMVGAPDDADVEVTSLQVHGSFSRTQLPGSFVSDERTLLALMLNGQSLSIDHGYPCRIIAPNRPGVLQTKWVSRLEVV